MNPMVDEILAVLKKDQHEVMVEIEAQVESNSPHSEFGGLFGIMLAVVENPEKVNWPAFMKGIEHFMGDPKFDEQAGLISQFILEGFSNFISNETFEAKWILNGMGAKTREFLNAYEEYHGSSTRY